MKPHYKLNCDGTREQAIRAQQRDTFSRLLLRLKLAVGLLNDCEIAALLGMSATAFSDRKKRASFPAKALWALSAKRPELNLDVGQILDANSLDDLKRVSTGRG